jgi:hypothetical protein
MNRKKRKKISSSAYKKRNYRQAVAASTGLVSNFVTVKEYTRGGVPLCPPLSKPAGKLYRIPSGFSNSPYSSGV